MPAAGTGELLSIGHVARRTGIAPDTIRVWERRYGKPVPVRLPSGHRRYTEGHVRWLRRVSEALARGHRAGKVVPASDEELSSMLAAEEAVRQVAEPSPVPGLLSLVRSYRLAPLAAALHDAWRRLGPARFLDEHVAPLLTAVGEEWRDCTLDVRHEHFMSEVVGNVLGSLRLGCPADARAPLLLFATLPGEDHDLGLHMAALLCASRRLRTRVLGTRTPVDQIVAAVAETQACAVALSVSLANGGVDTDRTLAALRRRLPAGVRIVVGGRGARGVRRGGQGIDYIGEIGEFREWMATHASG